MAGTLVFTATYNEADNIGELVRQIRVHLPGADVLVVDDASPDGTGAILDAMAAADPALRVIHRPAKLGLGTAHRLAMAYAIDRGYGLLVTMDADFSHDPRHLPELVAMLEGRDFVTGSRYMRGGRSGYGAARTLLSRTANLLTRALLRVPLHECTTSFRGFRVATLARLNLDLVRSNGYAFFVESLFLFSRIGARLGEFPIDFQDRRAGTSKISRQEIRRALLKLGGLFLRRTLGAAALRREVAARPARAGAPCPGCGSPYRSEIHPARGGASDHGAYRCTSNEHRSHGAIAQCLACGLVFDSTPPPPQRLRETYAGVEDPTYVANLAARDRTFRHNLGRIRRFLPDGGRLLDVGAYCGAFVKVAGEAGFDAVGVEPSAWAARYATEVLGQRVRCGTLADVSPEGPPFDVVTMWDVLEHLPDLAGELAAVRARLRPGGIFALSTLDVDAWYPRLAGERWPWYMDMHLHYFSRATLARILARAGFEVLHVRSYRHYVTADYLCEKLDAIGVPGASRARGLFARTPAKGLVLPVQLGDIQLVVCRRAGTAVSPAAPRAGAPRPGP